MWDGSGGGGRKGDIVILWEVRMAGGHMTLAAEPRRPLSSCYLLCLLPLSARSRHRDALTDHPGHRELMRTSLWPDHPLEKERPSSQTKIERFLWEPTWSSRSPGRLWEPTKVTGHLSVWCGNCRCLQWCYPSFYFQKLLLVACQHDFVLVLTKFNTKGNNYFSLLLEISSDPATQNNTVRRKKYYWTLRHSAHKDPKISENVTCRALAQTYSLILMK